MSESTNIKSDETSPETIETLETLSKLGLMPVDAAALVCEFIGRELQGVPSQYRRLAISRLRNKAKLVNESGFPYDATELIEAVCRGWETFD